ncbi:MAG: ABC transporter ATP-binding protein, partial [Anaerolineae bacterium]|nr:ABC transporter ATP-binding protein [Anaerolineae bacterium]
LNELANSAHRLLLLHAGQFRVGTADQILNADTLGEVYDVDVEVRQMNGRRMIIT